MFSRISSKSTSIGQLTMQHWLALSCFFSCLLLFIRMAATGYDTYLFLPWNLFLGFVPYAISQWLSNRIGIQESRAKFLLVSAAWLMFIPNSFYIVTDIFHLDKFDAAPKWFDLLLLFSFAWNGILFGVLSLQRMEVMFRLRWGNRAALFIIIAIMWLNAFGIYIGRYLRYNSWDVFMQPFSLFREMLFILFHPFQNKTEWGMIIVYAAFMFLLYNSIKKISGDAPRHSYSKN